MLPYLAFGVLWILLSDSALNEAVTDLSAQRHLAIYKGCAFVLVTGVLLALLLRRDFLARQESRGQLQEWERRHRQLFDASPQPMYVYDRESLRFLAVNDAAIERYGWSRDEFLTMTLADIRPAGEVSRLRSYVATLSMEAAHAAGIWRHRKRDGALIDAEITLHAMEFAGRPAALVLAQDITERLRAEQAVRESERLARSALDALPANIAILDESGTIISVNAAWRRFAQQNSASPATVCEGANYLAVCDRASGDDAALAHGFATGIRDVTSGRCEQYGVEYPCHSPAQTRWFVGRVTRFAGEGPLRLAVAHVDVTERRRAEQASREQADRLRQYLSASPCVVYTLAVSEGAFVPEWISENVETMLHYSVPAALAADWWLARVHPDDRAATATAAKAVLDSGAAVCGYRFLCGDGTWIWLHDQLRLQRDGDGHPSRIIGAWTDVTAIHEAQQALAASERRFRAAFEQATAGMAHTTPEEGRFLMCNQRLAELLGFTRDELLNLRVEDVTHPDDYQADLALAKRCRLGERQAYSREKRYVRKDGAVIWASVSGTLVRKSDGTPEYFAGVYLDITENKRAEAALRASETKLARAQQIAHLGSWELSLASGRVHWSDEMCRIFGVAPSEIDAPFDSVLAAVHPDDRQRVHEARQLAVDGASRLDVEHRIVRNDGLVRWVHTIGEVESDGAGRPIGIAGTSLDITDRRRAESALRMLSLAIEQSSESIVITDLEGRIEYVNEAFVRASGYPRAEVLGHNPRVLQSGKTPAETYHSMWAALKAGRKWRGEFQNRRKDGSEYLEAAVISPLRPADGRISNYVAVKADITEKRRTEQELERYRFRLEELVEERTAQLAQARRQAEAANEAKGAFLANMSHEIRTPMNGVLGMAELLAQSRLSDEQADLVRTIRESGMALLGIIDDILDFSKVEAGRLTIERTPVSAAAIAEGLCDSLLPVAVRKGVDLNVFVSPEIPERVLTDEVRLRQILYNLVGNSIKFSGGRGDKRGRVWLRVGVAAQTPLRLAFTVADNGIGMTQETVASLFTPFLQGEASTTRRFGGTGLGLTICRRLADLMHGEIAVASRLGEGSTFTLTLPVDVPADQPARVQPDLLGVHCVVLEGAAIDVDGLSAYLTHAGASVHRATSASDCQGVAAGLTGPVVALRDVADERGGEAATYEATPNLRHVLIKRGRRRRPRVEAADTDTVSLDIAGVRRHTLLHAVAIAAGRASPEAAQEQVNLTTPSAPVVRADDHKRLILVAEDDDVNRRVIKAQLELLGHTAAIAHNGAEALRMWRDGRYALLLTDLHMPVMDGYELTSAIRAQEAAAGARVLRRTPIVALTANALRGESEHAKGFGVDDYLTKPLQLEVLRKILDRWLYTVDAPPALAADPAAAPATANFDIGVLKAHVGDDPAILRDLLGHFLRNAKGQGTELRNACAGGAAEQAAAIAHKLKSSSRSIGALALGELCAEIEQIGRSGHCAALGWRIPSFDAALAQVEAEILRLLSTVDA